MSASFPLTSVTLIAKIKQLSPGEDSSAWVRFWNSYSLAIRQFAAMKGGEANADDIVMTVLGKLVDVLRTGQYSPEKGRFHSYLAGGEDESSSALMDTLAAPEESPETIDADWRQAVLKSAVEHVLTKTALSDRDRKVYRAYALEGRDIADVAKEFGLSRNSVSQIKSRIDKRIVAVGKELVRGA